MDRATDTLYITSNKFDERTQALVKIARLKGLAVVPHSPVDSKDPYVIYLGIQLQNWWPVVDFILDVRPCPNILPSESRDRAIVRESVEMVFRNAFDIGMFHQLYQPHLYKDGMVLPYGEPTLLDIAIGSFADTPIGEMFQWVRPLSQAVDDAIGGGLAHTMDRQLVAV